MVKQVIEGRRITISRPSRTKEMMPPCARDSRISLSGRNIGVNRDGGFDMFWKLSYAKIVNVASVCDEFPAASVEITVTTS